MRPGPIAFYLSSIYYTCKCWCAYMYLSSLLLFAGVLTAYAQKRPPNYSQDDMPITSFSCREKVVGGYYADPETDCQMFHVCVHLPGVGVRIIIRIFLSHHLLRCNWRNTMLCRFKISDSYAPTKHLSIKITKFVTIGTILTASCPPPHTIAILLICIK